MKSLQLHVSVIYTLRFLVENPNPTAMVISENSANIIEETVMIVKTIQIELEAIRGKGSHLILISILLLLHLELVEYLNSRVLVSKLEINIGIAELLKVLWLRFNQICQSENGNK